MEHRIGKARFKEPHHCTYSILPTKSKYNFHQIADKPNRLLRLGGYLKQNLGRWIESRYPPVNLDRIGKELNRSVQNLLTG